MDKCRDKDYECKKMKEDSKKLNKDHEKLKHNKEVVDFLKPHQEMGGESLKE